jgi:hypothetical protein
MCTAIAIAIRLLVDVRGGAGIAAAECVDTPQHHQGGHSSCESRDLLYGQENGGH